MGQVHGEKTNARIHQFAEKESKSVTIELVMNVFLEMFQHFAYLFICIVNNSSSRTCKYRTFG